MQRSSDQPRGYGLLIVNPAAEGASEELVDEVVAACGRWVRQVAVRCTEGPGDASKLALEAATGSTAEGPPPTVVIVVGGDGTVREVAQGMASAPRGGAETPMFVVPAGTANSCYRTLWGATPWRDALDQALADPGAALHSLDLARLEETGALVMTGACAGFPPQSIHEAGAITDLSGPQRYEAAMVRLVNRYEPYPGRVTVDGRVVHSGPTLLANVAGGRYRGGQFELMPYSVLDDGLLDVCVIDGENHPGDILRLTRDGSHLGVPGVVYARGRRIIIERLDRRPVWFEYDGEVLVEFGHTFTLEVVPNVVPVLAGASINPGSRYDNAS